jgi:hypothetical protein
MFRERCSESCRDLPIAQRFLNIVGRGGLKPDVLLARRDYVADLDIRAYFH